MRKKVIWISAIISAWLVIFVIPHHGMPDETQKTVFLLPKLWFEAIEKEGIKERIEAIVFIENLLEKNQNMSSLFELKSEEKDDDWTITLAPRASAIYKHSAIERILVLDFSKESLPCWTIRHDRHTYEIHNRQKWQRHRRATL